MDKVGDQTPVPVPKPRRHNNNTDTNLNNKIAYENVSIDLINKNINIKDENIQNNSKNKLQTNKMFLMINTTSMTSNNNESNNTQILTNLNDLANAPVKNQKNVSLDEVNKLSNIYNDDENVNIKPVPAPRRSNANTNSKQFNCAPSTGAINKIPTIDINDFIESPKATVKSKSGKCSGSYSFGNDDFDDDSPKKFSRKKRESISSLSSSHSSSSVTEGSKYHSPSPG